MSTVITTILVLGASLAILFDIASLCTSSWLETTRTMLGITIASTRGLFEECGMYSCQNLYFRGEKDRAEHLAAAFLIVPLFMLGVGIYTSVDNEIRHSHNGMTAGILFALAALLELTGVSIYSGLKKQELSVNPSSSLGYSFHLACVSVGFTFLSSILAFAGMIEPTNTRNWRILL